MTYNIVKSWDYALQALVSLYNAINQRYIKVSAYDNPFCY